MSAPKHLQQAEKPAVPRKLSVSGTAYVLAVAAGGGLVLLASVQQIHDQDLWLKWLPLAALTLLSGSASVKLPSIPATISVSETFVFASVLLFGPAAGALITALDGLIISAWLSTCRREWYRILFNVTAPALSIWLASSLYFSFPGIRPFTTGTVSIEVLIVPLAVFALTHFLVNTWSVALAISFQTNLPAPTVWRSHFPWLSLNYFGAASVAALIAIYTTDVSPVLLGVIVPLLLLLYFSFKVPMARIEDSLRHVEQVNSLYLSTIETLAMAVDAKDQVTHGHIRRVQLYATSLAKELGIRDEGLLKAIEASALLHDMGKLAIPEHILNKPGKLSDAEFEKMKMHASIGADILSAIEFPYPVVPIVRHHHENWNGTGYPDGLGGTDIPIGARILAVVDCYDALTSDRPYRPSLSDEQAVGILLQRRGTMYDPLVVDTFLRVHAELSAEHMRDMSAPHPAFADLHRGSFRRLADVVPSGPYDERPTHQGTSGSNHTNIRALPAAERVCSQIRDAVNASAYVLATYDKAADQLVIQVASGESVSSLLGQRITLGQRALGWVAANRRTMLNADPTLDFASGVVVAVPNLTASIIFPVCENDELLAVLGLYGRQSFEKHCEVVVERALPGLIEALKPGMRLRRVAAS